MSKKTLPQPAQIFIAPAEDIKKTAQGGGPDAGINLLEYYYMIRRRMWLFLPFPVLFAVAAIIYVQTATPKYVASCRLLLEPAVANIANIAEVYDPTSGIRDFDTFIQTQMQLIKTQDIVSRTFQYFKFADRKEYRDSMDPLSDFRELITIKAETDTFLVSVAFESTDAQEAADVANYISQLYVDNYRARQKGVSGAGLTKLRAQLVEMRKAREEARETLTDFKEKEELINLNDAQMLLIERISSINRALIDAQVEEAQLKAMLAAVDLWQKEHGKNLDMVPKAMQNPAVTAFKVERLRAEAKLPELLSKYGRTHNVVQTHLKVIETMTKAVEDEITKSLQAMYLEYSRSQMRTSLLKAELQNLQKETMWLDKTSGEYRILEDAYISSEKSYRMLINRINEINIAKNTEDLEGAGAVRVVNPAIAAKLPAKPKKRRTVMLAGIVGTSLGGGLCLLLGLLDTTVKLKDEAEDLLGKAPTLGYLPAHKASSVLAALEDPSGILAEAFRSIRTNLDLSFGGCNEKVFAITSSEVTEGKSTTAFNLALSLAADGKKVLLLECDMRRPSLRKVLEEELTSTDSAFSKVLIGDTELMDEITGIEGQGNLDMVLCGPVPPNPAKLLGTPRFKKIMEQAKAEYDMVILDAPPVLRIADTSILAGHDIPLIAVVRLFRTKRRHLDMFAQQVDTVQGRIVGIVCNQIDAP